MSLDKNKKMYMIRAGERGYLFDDFQSKSIIAIGFYDLGDLSHITSEKDLTEHIRHIYAGKGAARIRSIKSSVKRFRFDFSVGDLVMTYNSSERIYLIGTITGEYTYKKNVIDYSNIRTVEWKGTISRDQLSISSRNSLGAIMTLFLVPKNVKLEILNLLNNEIGIDEAGDTGEVEDTEDISEDLGDLKEDIQQKAKEFIKDKITELKPYEMQDLFAGVLRAMGYKTQVSTRGYDRGIDIMASPDGLGLENPRIIVQVKHKKQNKVNSEEIRSFIPVLKTGDKGIYYSTTGFSKDAKYEADRAPIPIKAIDGDGLVDLIIQYYEQFDPDTRSLIPLMRIYWPVYTIHKGSGDQE